MITHDYVVCVRCLREEEGGGFIATIPQLGIGAFNGDGETPAEAIRNLDEIYNYWHSRWMEDGREEDLFPEPIDEGLIGSLIHDYCRAAGGR